MNCDSQCLQKAFTQRTIETIKDVVTSPLNRELAVYARDALAKAVYDRLFTWLVKRINSSLQPGDKRRNREVMGILDIYGFEIFEKNRYKFCKNVYTQILTIKYWTLNYDFVILVLNNYALIFATKNFNNFL